MANILNSIFQGLTAEPELRDYQHAARTFVDSNYRLSPKLQNLFHISIQLNTFATRDPQNPNSPIELGLLAKTATLPKFTIQNKVLNSYNRKNVVQEKVNYDPITITFHDDSADVVRNFWQNYYYYYFRDSDHSATLYNQDYKYVPRSEQNWGFTPNGSNAQNYINTITIYSMHQKRFSSYTMFRPTITSFAHGQHTQGEYLPLEHSMTFVYEAVQYQSGSVSSSTVTGFDLLHYDNTPSPLTSLGGGTTSIFGQGGLIQGTNDVISDITNNNFGAAAISTLNISNNFSNQNLSTIATAELTATAQNILRGQNTQSTIFVPTASSVQNGLATAVNPSPSFTPSRGGINNMNTQNAQVPSTNQGIASTLLNLF